jgi:hypothetical protein
MNDYKTTREFEEFIRKERLISKSKTMYQVSTNMVDGIGDKIKLYVEACDVKEVLSIFGKYQEYITCIKKIGLWSLGGRK